MVVSRLAIFYLIVQFTLRDKKIDDGLPQHHGEDRQVVNTRGSLSGFPVDDRALGYTKTLVQHLQDKIRARPPEFLSGLSYFGAVKLPMRFHKSKIT